MTNTEKRQMGGLLVVQRDIRKSGGQVLMVADQPKWQEIAAGLPWQFNADVSTPKWSFPGGGRDVTATGQEETLLQTLEREWQEELGEKIGVLLELQKTELRYQLYPFLIGQVKSPQAAKVDVFAATSATVQFDSLAREAQVGIEQRARKEEDAVWVDVEPLSSIYLWAVLENRYPNLTSIRPQTLACAYLWDAERFMEEQLLVRFTQFRNKKAYARVLERADLNLPTPLRLNNGAFSDTGELKDDFSPDDQAYLFARKQGVNS